MKEIGNLLVLTREAAGISLKEVSEDLGIEEAILDNIEDGRVGAFSDVFELKKFIFNYSKYLGLDADNVIDDFNSYIFEATSKIPIKEIEKQVSEILKTEEESQDERIISPYTKKEKKKPQWILITAYVVVLICFFSAIIWCVKQITINRNATGNIIERI